MINQKQISMEIREAKCIAPRCSKISKDQGSSHRLRKAYFCKAKSILLRYNKQHSLVKIDKEQLTIDHHLDFACPSLLRFNNARDAQLHVTLFKTLTVTAICGKPYHIPNLWENEFIHGSFHFSLLLFFGFMELLSQPAWVRQPQQRQFHFPAHCLPVLVGACSSSRVCSAPTHMLGPKK